MLTLKEAVVVEGKYDKIKLSSILNAVIIQTNGFGIYKDKEKLQMIRFYAEKTGIIILTDSDSAGFQIRNYLKGAIKKGSITNVYIPDIFGKEKRKTKYSAEGKLGVEGIDTKILIDAFNKAKINCVEKENENLITKQDFYFLGLTGGKDSSQKREKLKKYLNFPSLISTNSLLEMVNTMMNKDELTAIMQKIENENNIENKEEISG